MKITNKLCLIFFTIVSTLFLMCCSKDDSTSIAGSWIAVGYWDMPGYCPAQNSYHDINRSVITFNKNGTVISEGKSYNYSIEDDEISIKYDNKTEKYTYNISGNNLSLKRTVYPHGITNQYSDCRHTINTIYERGGTEGGGTEGGGTITKAPQSISGKTFDGNMYFIASFNGASRCSIDFNTSIYTVVGSPSYSYSVSGTTNATLKLTFNSRMDLTGITNLSETVTMTLTFLTPNSGTYFGTHAYTATGVLNKKESTPISGAFTMK